MPESLYQVAPIFLIRLTGVPFEVLDQIATPATAAGARALLVRQTEFEKAKAEVEAILASRKHNLSRELFQAWRKAVRLGIMPPVTDAPSRAFVDFWSSAAEMAKAETALDQSLNGELERARRASFLSASRHLPGYFVFAAEGIKELLGEMLATSENATLELPPRRKKERARERHLLLYLQRVCAKNDTLSEFGPHGWGRADAATRGISLTPEPGIQKRETFLERWTAHGVAAAMNTDPEVRLEIAPRLNPNGRLENDHFIFSETGERVALEPEIMKLLRRCDGRTAAHSLGASAELLAECAEKNFLRWEVEVPALEPHAFDRLVGEIDAWRDTPTRARWLEKFAPIAARPNEFARATDAALRLSIMNNAGNELENLGAQKTSNRFLYAATNPIGEECFRACNFSISEKLLDQVALEAAPWLDLWRDNYAFVASRVAVGLRRLLEQTPAQDGAVPLPAFLRHCADAKMSLTGPGLVALAHLAFREVRAKFQELFHDRGELAELRLTTNDCAFVRQNFPFPPFDEYTFPSADLQLSATSLEALERGEYQWMLAELHPPVALLHHGFYWSCPDKAALSAALAKTTGGKPAPHFGIFVADFTATTCVHLFDSLPNENVFVAPQLPNDSWHRVRPAEVEVFVEESSGDVALRHHQSREYLGSLARNWIIPLGFHPFGFSLGKNTPRLLCGNVVVQRRTWTIEEKELGDGDFTGVSRDLVVAVERLRARRDLPRHIYIRPTEQALRRSGAEGRDKDTKPVYIDLESYLFLEIFHRWLGKSGELEVTEMLPDPDHLFWREKDGRRTFELRTQIVPR
ncbi:MAG TPA: hypothetical protein VGG02_08835 [Chthoniobacterales bacterium]